MTGDIKKLVNPYGIASLHYLCADCDKYMSTEDSSKKEVNASRQNTAEPQQQQDTDGLSLNTNSIESFPGEDIRSTPLLPEVHVRNNGENVSMKNTQASENFPLTEDSRNKGVAKASGICNYYRKGSCRHGRKGIDCKYAHPKPCKKLMQHGNKGPRGCKEGRNCQSLHPIMCADSISKGECFNDKCHNIHVKGTKRKGNVKKVCYEEMESRTGEHSQETCGDKSEQYPRTHTSTKHDFLDMFHNFKREIMEAMDLKINTMMNISTPRTFFQDHQMFPRQMEAMPINLPVKATANQMFPVRPTPNIAAPMEWTSVPGGIPVRY